MTSAHVISSFDLCGVPCVSVGGCGNFSVEKTFDCGQAFRFDRIQAAENSYDSACAAFVRGAGCAGPTDKQEIPENGTAGVGGSGNATVVVSALENGTAADEGEACDNAAESSVCGAAFGGIAFGRRVVFEERGGGVIRIYGCMGEEDFEKVWKKYLSLDEDYDAIDRSIVSAMVCDSDRRVMEAAVRCGAGIRILKQDPFECLISFIISQNNNIPRIKKIISALCEKYGENGSFPTPEALVNAGEEELFALKTGFRAGYIYDAAKRVASGETDLSAVFAADFADAEKQLCLIRGVGPKVSACVLLFGFGKTEAFPIDVWMKKSLERHFPGGFDPSRLGKNAGIAQQYLFYYERWLGGGEKEVSPK